MQSFETKFISLNLHQTNLTSKPDLSINQTNNDSIFEFKFIEEGFYSFCGISISSVQRKDQSWQNQILSITDFSQQSNKQPILFIGDLFNFTLNPTSSKNYNHQMSYNYFNSIANMKGFPNDTIILSSNTTDYNKIMFKLSSMLLNDNDYVQQKIQKKDFSCDTMFENKLIQPILNANDKKLINILKQKNLNENDPENILKLLNAIKTSLN